MLVQVVFWCSAIGALEKQCVCVVPSVFINRLSVNLHFLAESSEEEKINFYVPKFYIHNYIILSPFL